MTNCFMLFIGVNKSASESITEYNNIVSGKSITGIRRCHYIIVFHVQI